MNTISDEYHIYYEKNRLWEHTYWLGVNVQKNPCDMIIIQELITRIRPDLIVETGTRHGGSSLFFASICELIGNGEVISIDNDPTNLKLDAIKSFPQSKRITYLTGESTNPDIVARVKERVGKSVMVLLDSWHSEKYVLQELQAYSNMVTIGSYLIVEDTHIWNPAPWAYEDLGPMAALKTFMKDNTKFVSDKDCEKLHFTFNPDGYLKRI